MKINLNSFSDFFKSVFGCKPEEVIQDFKPFCEYDWKERTLTLTTKDCSQLLKLHHDENSNKGYLELIYNNHNEKELIGFIINLHTLNLYSSGSLVINLYFYSNKLANPNRISDSNWKQSSYTILESLLRNIRIDIKLKKKLYHLIGMVDGVEHKNYDGSYN